MVAVNAADLNAEGLLAKLSLQYDRVRQAAITQEMAPVITEAGAQRETRKKGQRSKIQKKPAPETAESDY